MALFVKGLIPKIDPPYCPLEKLANAHCTSTVCTVYTHSAHHTIGLSCSICSINRYILKNVIYKYPPSFLTLPAFYQLVCYTVLLEAMCVEIFPHKTTTTVCLGFFLHTSSMGWTDKPRNNKRRK